MSTGNPNFNPKPTLPNKAEKLKSKQELQWEQKRAEIEEIADATGRGIDEGVKDTVAAFNVNGIPTSMSCEGHDEVKGGHRPWPWVRVSAPDEPEERFVGEIQASADFAKEHNVPLEELKRGYPEDLYTELQKKICQNEETPEYQEWEEKNKKLYALVTKILGEYYKDREVDEDIRLQSEETSGFPFEVSSEGMDIFKFIDNDLTEEERNKLLEKLPMRQKEMQDFTAFLKERFLAKKENISEEEETFNEYVADLRIKPEDFKKVILDVGAGEAHFAKWAKDHDISSQIYSLEPRQKMSIKENTLISSAEKIPMPDKSFDLVVSNGAIPGIYMGEDNVEEKLKKSFSEMLRVLKDGGEIRLARVSMGDKYESQRIFTRTLENLLKELQDKYNIGIEKIHMFDTYEYENGHPTKELLAEVFSIILKKRESSLNEPEEKEGEITEWLAETLKHFEEIFDLSEDNLRNKKILEIGAFDRHIAAALLLSGIPVEAYSLEPALSGEEKEGYAPKEMLMAVLNKLPKEVREEVEKRTIVSAAEEIPVEDNTFDIVLGKSIPHYSSEQLTKRIAELLRVGREVRLYPITPDNRSDYESAIQSIKSIPVTIEYKTTTEGDIPTEDGIVHLKHDVLILRKKK